MTNCPDGRNFKPGFGKVGLKSSPPRPKVGPTLRTALILIAEEIHPKGSSTLRPLADLIAAQDTNTGAAHAFIQENQLGLAHTGYRGLV